MLNDIRIIIHTAKGDMEATLFPSKAPVTTANFLNLASRKFYDGLTFHRVVPRFVIQGGDPVGTGSGGPGYRFENEVHPSLVPRQCRCAGDGECRTEHQRQPVLRDD